MSISLDNVAEKTFDNFKKITPALVAVAILTGLLLFLPKSILAKMNLDELPVLWNRIIGIIFLLSIALIATMIVFSAISRIASKQREKRINENLKKKYQSLSSKQKSIIMQLLRSKDKTIILDKYSGDTIYLEDNLFIHMPQQLVTVDWDNQMKVRYVPHPWLMELYNAEPELFKADNK